MGKSFRMEKLLERRKTEPTIVLSNSLTDIDDTPTFADLTESRKEETNMTNEERNSNSINALYSAKNKISNILYIAKGKMSNRPETSSEEQKAKPLVRGIPYHSEMRMKRRGTISLHLKSIYLDDAERKIKSKRKSSTENNDCIARKMRTARSLTVCRSRSICPGGCASCMLPSHACPSAMYADQPRMPPRPCMLPSHACPPAINAPLTMNAPMAMHPPSQSCMPPRLNMPPPGHARPPCGQTHCENITLPQLRCVRYLCFYQKVIPYKKMIYVPRQGFLT